MKKGVNTSVLELFGSGIASDTKIWRSGTHRTRDPATTLNWLSPKLSSMGITRVADITGLDCIGVPVIMVVRPNSRSLAVSQGKGLTLVNAQVSGLMESVETFHAERIELPLRLTSESSLALKERVVDASRLARSGEHEYANDMRLLWIQGRDLLSGENVWLPYESVHTDFTLPRPSGSGYFPADSNGLAAGNHPVEAVVHALCEVVERDAVALWHQSESQHEYAIDPESIDDAEVSGLLSRLHKAYMDVQIWDVTSDTKIPCFNCLVVGKDNNSADPEFGSGCHPDKRVALLRALTEAVQARTTFIAGSRDDLGLDAYTVQARADRLAACRGLIDGRAGAMAFDSIPVHMFDSVAADLEWILSRLAAVGIEEVLWVDLTLSDYQIPVVKVVVPGLEGAWKGANSDYVPGDRARRLSQS